MNEPTEPQPGWTEALGRHADNPPDPRTTGETIVVYAACLQCTVFPQAPLGTGKSEQGEKCSTCQGSGSSTTVFGEWTISSCENRIKAQFEQWIRRRARQAIDEADASGDSEEAGALRSVYMADIGAGHYSWEGKHCRNALRDTYGIRHLLFLLLRRCHPEIKEDEVGWIFRANARGCALALRWALGNSFSPSQPPSPGGTSLKTNGNTTPKPKMTATRPTTFD